MATLFFCVRCGNGTRLSYGYRSICRSCTFEKIDESKAATRKVAKLIKAGLMEKASAYVCVDCGLPAMDYDHRDYLKPLDVQPVCRGCNGRRGPALDSKVRDFSFFTVPVFDTRALEQRVKRYRSPNAPTQAA